MHKLVMYHPRCGFRSPSVCAIFFLPAAALTTMSRVLVCWKLRRSRLFLGADLYFGCRLECRADSASPLQLRGDETGPHHSSAWVTIAALLSLGGHRRGRGKRSSSHGGTRRRIAHFRGVREEARRRLEWNFVGDLRLGCIHCRTRTMFTTPLEIMQYFTQQVSSAWFNPGGLLRFPETPMRLLSWRLFDLLSRSTISAVLLRSRADGCRDVCSGPLCAHG